MRKSLLVLMLSMAAALRSQAQPEKLEFEVASVKPAAPQENGRVFVGRQGGPGTQDPGRLTYTNYPLKALITTAFDVKAYQVTGPAWIETERFDLAAKIPPGSSKEQVNEMLQNLLADRFKLTLHRTTKEFPLYELLVGKNGPKMKASVEDPKASDTPAVGERTVPPPLGKDGMPVLTPGRRGMMMMFGNGSLRIAANVQSMKDFAEMLSNQVGTPVVDKTGLTGTYDFTLEFVPEQGKGGILIAPGAGLGPGLGGGANNSFDGPTIFGAVQDQLGLRLEQKKGPLDVLVIDQAEKVPTAN